MTKLIILKGQESMLQKDIIEVYDGLGMGI